MTPGTQYGLDECKHNFHTKCIMNWFRGGNHICPYCGDVGLNKEIYENGVNKYTPSIWFNDEVAYHKYYSLKKLINRKQFPDDLRDKYGKVQKLRNEYRVLVKDNDRISRSSTPIIYKNMLKKKTTNIKKIWRLRTRIKKLLEEIHHVPVVPLVIPVRKYF